MHNKNPKEGREKVMEILCEETMAKISPNLIKKN